MKAARSTALAAANPEKQLETFISKFDQKDQQLIRAVRRAVPQMVSDCKRAGVGQLPDPKKVLLGSGNQTRFIRLESAGVLARPEVRALLAAAIARARAPLPPTGRGKLVIRSVSAKQRPRRKPVAVRT